MNIHAEKMIKSTAKNFIVEFVPQGEFMDLGTVRRIYAIRHTISTIDTCHHSEKICQLPFLLTKYCAHVVFMQNTALFGRLERKLQHLAFFSKLQLQSSSRQV